MNVYWIISKSNMKNRTMYLKWWKSISQFKELIFRVFKISLPKVFEKRLQRENTVTMRQKDSWNRTAFKSPTDAEYNKRVRRRSYGIFFSNCSCGQVFPKWLLRWEEEMIMMMQVASDSLSIKWERPSSSIERLWRLVTAGKSLNLSISCCRNCLQQQKVSGN